MKKVISVVGARPNFMKVAPIDRAFRKWSDKIEHVIVHTGQHYDAAMSDAFFKDLEMPAPKHFLAVGSGTHAEQTAKVILAFEKVLLQEKPDLVIVVGDVNSTIAATLTAVKLGIKTAHVEGGLRSFDRTMPEEINRKATDAIRAYCFVTEPSGEENLLKEGFPKENVFFVGNVMIDSQKNALPKAKKSKILKKLGLSKGEYAVATLHRPSNVDSPERLEESLRILKRAAKYKKVVFPIHPRTRKNAREFGLDSYFESGDIVAIEPLGYVDFLALLLDCDFVLTDSGGIQEETTALGIPCLTLRTTTERPITLELGLNRLVEPSFEAASRAIDELAAKKPKSAGAPPLWDGKAADRIAEIIAEKILA